MNYVNLLNRYVTIARKHVFKFIPNFRAKIRNLIEHITHYIVRIVTEKIQKHTFTPGLATEVSIDHAGHLSNMENPEQFNNQLRKFLKTLI